MFQVLFALHLYVVADVPPEYGALVFEAALEEGIDPYDLGAVLISEKSGPDYDFSLLSALSSDTVYTWETDAEGSAGERGLFQLVGRHAYKTGHQPEDLLEPKPNILTAASVVRHNHERHERCGENSVHDWIAHFKCAPAARDYLRGQCRYAQVKWTYLRHSLTSVFKPDFKAIKKAYKRRLKKLSKTES